MPNLFTADKCFCVVVLIILFFPLHPPVPPAVLHVWVPSVFSISLRSDLPVQMSCFLALPCAHFLPYALSATSAVLLCILGIFSGDCNVAGLLSVQMADSCMHVRASWQVNNYSSTLPTVTKGSMRAQLSPECTDLLNKIFVINEKERITIAQIKEHPWYNVPLVPKYAEAERDIEARQRRVEQYIRQRDLNIVRSQYPSVSMVWGRLCPCWGFENGDIRKERGTEHRDFGGS